MQRLLVLLALALLGLAVTPDSAALAQAPQAGAWVLLAPGGNAPSAFAQPVMQALRASLEDAQQEALALERLPARLPATLQSELTPELRACRAADCARRVLRVAQQAEPPVAVALAVALWRGPSSGSAAGASAGGEAAVSVVTPSLSFTETERVEDVEDPAAFAAAAKRALGTAFLRWTLGPGPWLAVSGRPVGALVELDDQPVGALPFRGKVAPGPHRVRISATGQPPLERSLTIPADPTHYAALSVDLAHPEAAPTATSTSERPSPWNYALAGGLAAAAVPFLWSGFSTLAQDGDCVGDETATGCTERAQFGAQSGVFIGLGVALLAGAVTVAIVRPIRVSAEVDPHSARINFATTF